jgi:hypothetical protein
MVERIKGVTVTTLVNGRGVDVVFRSPYRWRIYEDDRDVTKSFGFPLIGGVYEDDPRWQAFHAETAANEFRVVLATA